VIAAMSRVELSARALFSVLHVFSVSWRTTRAAGRAGGKAFFGPHELPNTQPLPGETAEYAHT